MMTTVNRISSAPPKPKIANQPGDVRGVNTIELICSVMEPKVRSSATYLDRSDPECAGGVSLGTRISGAGVGMLPFLVEERQVRVVQGGEVRRAWFRVEIG